MIATPLRNLMSRCCQDRLNVKVRVFAVASIGLASFIAASGCQEMVTYSEASQEKGIELYNQGNYADAQGAFTNAIRQDPRDYKSDYYLGRTYEATGAYQQAVQSYRTALNVMQMSLLGKQDTALREKVLDGYASAIAKSEDHFAQTASLRQEANPSPEDAFVLAKVLRIHGDADSAIDAYAKAIRLDPNNLAVSREFALYLDQLNQLQQSKPELIHAYQLNRKAGSADDEQINAALRHAGVVPGPALMDEKDLTHPAVPVGPLPEVDVTRLRLQNPFRVAPEQPAAPAVNATPHD